VICIFAEGESHAEPRVRELRTGTARIVLEAEERRGNALNVAVVPVGLYFPEEDRYFSDGVVVFGEPIDTAPFRAQYADDRSGAVTALTAAIHDRLQLLTLHVPDWRWASFVEQTVDLQVKRPGPPLSAEARLRESQTVAEAIGLFAAADPSSAERLRRDTDYLWMRVEASHRHALPATDSLERRRGIRQRLRDAVALPIATFGFFFNGPPYLVPRIWSQLFVHRREKRAFVKFLVGAPTIAAWYLTTTHWVGKRSMSAGLALWVVGPLSGLLALRLRAHRRRWLDAWRRIDRTADVQREAELADEQEALLARLEPWIVVHRAERSAAKGTAARQPSRSLN
jgi:hypothetical protein